ncbi:helix-turn-helix domain-containing protein [Labedaea rhizosphaerae]|uniref:helix-turn-helix domain-containing protein n=1 Tax=Labedaea rhizosphaerae TaxID=598644 RepID=UPI00105FA986|nr:helix-turn-helix domain-containing protein [Labedaea rhizosphaerae]
MNEKFYRPAEVAKLLRCSEWWIKEQARKRRIPYAWIGGAYLFAESHIAEIVNLFERRPGDGHAAESAAPAPRRRSASRGGSVTQLRAKPPRRARSGLDNSEVA